MEKQSKSRKPLIVGIIAAVVILAVLLVLLLTQCTGGQGDQTSTPATETTVDAVPEYQLYWNLDRAEYDGKSEAGLSSRMPEEDGYFYVRFFCDGEEVTVKVAARKLINAIDVQDVVGLEFDENGVVVDVLKLEDMPLEKVGWQFSVQSAARTAIKLNSSAKLNGMEVMLSNVDPNRIWDMSGKAGAVGTVDTPITYDKVMAVQNLAGEVTHVFIYERPNYMVTHEGYCQHCDKTVTWYEWVKDTEAPTDSGHYQLQNDIQRNGAQYNLADETKLCLDLNGYRIDGKTNSRVYRLYGATIDFAVMDTSEAQTGVIAAHGKVDQGGVIWPTSGAFYLYSGTIDASDATTEKFAPAISVSSGAYFYMYGGTVVGGVAKPAYNTETGKYSGGYAGSIWVGGKFVMNGGVIENGRAQATIVYTNGTPTYNNGYGGNLVVGTNGVFEMNGGIIRYGKSDGTGGNIYTGSGAVEITMNGGSIQGGITYGKGKNGGNIFAGSKTVFTMNGGSIVGGVSYNGGGNVYTNGSFIMNSGYIGGGALMNFTTGKRNTTGASYNMMIVNGKLTLWGGTVLGGVSIQDTSADGKYQAQLSINGWAKVHGDETGKNLTISKNGDGVTVNVGTLYNGADIWVNASGIFTEPTKEANLQYFHSDVENVDVVYYQNCLAMGKASCICGASQTDTPNAHDVGCDGTVLFWGPWTSTSSLPTTTGNYFLVKDVATIAQSVVGKNQDVKLDLNGHNITLDVPTTMWDGFRLYRADYNGTLAITDTQAKLTGKVGVLQTVVPDADEAYTGGKFTTGGVTYVGDAAKEKVRDIWDRTGNFGMLLWARGGDISIHNGIFDGSNINATQSGAVWHLGSVTETNAETGEQTIYYGQIDFYNGQVICGNLTGGNGNIDVPANCVMNIYGGTIENGVENAKVNTRVYVASGGKLLLAGGNIDGGVKSLGSVTLSGAPVVGAEDGALYGTGEINIDGTLAAGAQVYTSKTGYITGETVEANKNFVFSTIEGLEINYLDKKLFAGKMGCLCNYGKTVNGEKVTEHTDGCIAAMTDIGMDPDKDLLQMSVLTAENYSSIGKTGGNWYLSGDLTIGNAAKQDAPIVYLQNGTTLIIDLNGKTLTINRAGMAFSTQNSAKDGQSCTLIITDTSAEQTGKIELVGSSYLDSTGKVVANQGGIVRLWGRTANSDKTTYPDGYEYADNTVYLLAGTLDASAYNVGMAGHTAYGGAVEVHHKQSMYMYGGTIIGSQSDYISYGAAVYVNTGYMYMYGGTIYGAKNADVTVVRNSNVFEMYGGTICGGLSSATNKIKISGTAVINKDLTPEGYTVPNYSLLVATGKTVDFEGLAEGAEVYVSAGDKFGVNADATGATLVKSDSELSAVELRGTDLYMVYADLVHCVCGVDSTDPADHTDFCDGTVYTWKPWISTTAMPTEGGWYYLTQNVSLSATPKLTTGNTIYIDLMGNDINLTGGAKLYLAYALTDTTVVVTDTTAQKEGTITATHTAGGNGGIMDIGNRSVFVLYRATLDARKFTSTENGSVACIRGGGEFIMNSGTIYGGNVTHDANGGKKSGAVFRMFGTAAQNLSSTVTVKGGTIYGGSAEADGGVVTSYGCTAQSPNVLNISDATIIGGSASIGGAIFASGYTNVTLHNTVIEGASVKTNGAVYTAGTTTLTISGTTTIVDNTTADGLNACNLYVNNSLLTIANGFTGKISLAGKTGVALTASITTLDDALITGKNVVLDDAENYRFKLYDDKLGMEEIPPEARMQCVCGGVLKGTEGHTCAEVEFKPWTSTNSLPTAGNYFLNKNVGLSATAVISADVNIDLNGKTVSNANGAVLSVTAGTVIITDSTATAGTISGGAGGVLKVSGNSVVNLYAGTVTGGKSNDGAVQLTGTSKLNLAGSVQITANTTANGSAACNVVANGGTMAFLPGFTGKVGIAGTYGKLVVTGITTLDDALLTGGNVALDDTSGNFKLVADANGLTYGLANESLLYACVCGGTLTDGKYDHTCEMIFWEPWDKVDSLPTTTGNYYLMDTVNLASARTVAADAIVRLDLNGKTVNLADNVQMYKFADGNDSTLIITDTTEAPGSVIAVGGAGNGGIMDISKSNYVEVYNITLDASARTTRENGAVAAVRADSELVTFNAIVKGGNANNEKKAGAVYRLFASDAANGYANAGTVTAYGGTIYGGTATDAAGVIYANSINVIYFEDVEIIGGQAVTGGAISLSADSQMTMKNCVIDGSHATSKGGAAYLTNNAKLTLDGTTIKNCTSDGTGGAIYIDSSAQVTMNNSSMIKDTHAKSYGGAFYVNAVNSKLFMNDSTIDGATTDTTAALYLAHGHATLNNSVIMNCVGVNIGGAIRIQYSDATMTVKGNTQIVGNKRGTAENNIGWNQAGQITLDDSFTGTIGLFNSQSTGVVPSITSLTDPRVGVNVVLDDPNTYEFTLIGGILGIKKK